ncbi:response regulator [Planctomycetota bacterium]|nr:response regulator [Planctomycetota bacterium]
MSEKKTILVVDDETHILHVVSLKLRNAGYTVITAEDGEEGLATAIDSNPDLVISDYQMPYMTGMELCVKLKEHEQTQHTPALMLTARGFSLSNEYIDKTNIVGVITKPFSPREILGRVDHLLHHCSSIQEARKAS